MTRRGTSDRRARPTAKAATPVIFGLPGNEAMAKRLARRLKARLGRAAVRRFPDGESYVRIDTPVAGREVVVVCTLDRPDDKFLALAFFAATARDLGASRVGLVCPYLAYLRQDRRFRKGEGLTSSYFAKALGRHFDWLVTVDPHLHRLRDLSKLYAMPCAIVHAAPLISDWIRRKVAAPLIIGPDAESEQWVAAVARDADAPYVVLAKRRSGDRSVRVSRPPRPAARPRTPVLVDDIVSTAGTMIETVRRLRDAGHPPPCCVAVHAVFADGGYEALRAAGASPIVTCNTVAHPSNAIDVTAVLADAVRRVRAGDSQG